MGIPLREAVADLRGGGGWTLERRRTQRARLINLLRHALALPRIPAARERALRYLEARMHPRIDPVDGELVLYHPTTPAAAGGAGQRGLCPAIGQGRTMLALYWSLDHARAARGARVAIVELSIPITWPRLRPLRLERRRRRVLAQAVIPAGFVRAVEPAPPRSSARSR